MFKSAAKFIAKAAIASAIFVLFFKIAFVHTCGACGAVTFDSWQIQNQKGQLVDVYQECYHEVRATENFD